MGDSKGKPRNGKHTSVRLSPEEAQIADKMGGVTAAFRKFLREKVLNSDEVAEKMQAKSKELAELDERRGKLFDEIEKLRTQYTALKEYEKRLLERDGPEYELTEKGVSSLSTGHSPKTARPVNKSVNRLAWEQKAKIYYLLVYAITGSIAEPDCRSITNHLQLKQPATPLEWVLGPSPDTVPLKTLEYNRTAKYSKEYNLQNAKEKGLISPDFYNLLMKWLHADSQKEVDAWIDVGGDMKSVRDHIILTSEDPSPGNSTEVVHPDQPTVTASLDIQSLTNQEAPTCGTATDKNRGSEDLLLNIATRTAETQPGENRGDLKPDGE
jgi:hypothetical protein